ncbi:hypothetical protein BMS3Abin02_00254 [bacterium BMS3Abin02]|nr:hypothetical protein BMS3Abin02_00254 [bacterium BMS3Abin02]GBE22883.1 hypothetical protein BMS3Bbin01_02260 [bacterium BMS3Bbin01]HDH27019.1 hypothetical protein [Actinomycetota bacterium]
MQSLTVLAKLEEAITRQVGLSGEDAAVEAAAEAMLGVLDATVRQIVIDLAQQAAIEVSAQLPGYEVEVVISDGEPELRVRASEAGGEVAPGSYEARLTLRLPNSIKELIEDAAADTGDSVNSWVVKTLSTRVRVRHGGKGKRISGTVEL